MFYDFFFVLFGRVATEEVVSWSFKKPPCLLLGVWAALLRYARVLMGLLGSLVSMSQVGPFSNGVSTTWSLCWIPFRASQPVRVRTTKILCRSRLQLAVFSCCRRIVACSSRSILCTSFQYSPAPQSSPEWVLQFNQENSTLGTPRVFLGITLVRFSVPRFPCVLIRQCSLYFLPPRVSDFIPVSNFTTCAI